MRSFSRYCDPASADKLVAVQSKIDIVKASMSENIQQLLQNEEKLAHLESAATELHGQSQRFNSSAKNLVRKMWWQNMRVKLAIAAVVIVIIVIIVSVSMTSSGSSGKDK